jgi:2-oxoglutarate dehydrogenase E1 component
VARQETQVNPPQRPAKDVDTSEQLVPLRGAPLRIAENMIQSLQVPTATSQRAIPVKVIDENRQIINQQRSLLGLSKISYTHIIGWAIVKALATNPALNCAYVENNGEAFRAVRSAVHLGLAIDLPSRDGGRSLVVPNIKNAGTLNFSEFLKAYDDLINRGRKGKLTIADFQGTTVSLTNPGTLGTVGSIPRLMPGQGSIIATGARGTRRRGPGDAGDAGPGQGDDGDLHLRSSDHPGRRKRHVPGQAAGFAAGRRQLLRHDLR